MKNIGILGSTGSVGTQSLQVIGNHKDKFNIKFLAANTNADDLIMQCLKFDPSMFVYMISQSMNTSKTMLKQKIF